MKYSKRAYITQFAVMLSVVSLLFSVAVANFTSSLQPNTSATNDGISASASQIIDAAAAIASSLPEVTEDAIDHDSEYKHDEPVVVAQSTEKSAPISPAPPPAPITPYNLTSNGVTSDLGSLGYSLGNVRAAGTNVIGHAGTIPKRCNGTSQGLAVRDVQYKACPDGQQPLYEAYHDVLYSCTVVYNQNSGKKLAILAHEIGHCFYHNYGEFDIEYKQLRDAYHLDQTAIRELIADDFMICMHNQDTNWSGSANYYTKYNMPRPDASTCTTFNTLVNTYLF